MISQCERCGSWQRNKTVEGNVIHCPVCGNRWTFLKKPLFILTGCSGVGKTTTAQHLQKSTTDYIVLDADLFYSIMPHETEEDSLEQLEQIGKFSSSMMQCGKPVLWAMAGNIDKLGQTYHSRFFSDIRVLALICEEELLIKRMTEGRGITDNGWLRSSAEYNAYFQNHTRIGPTHYDKLDISFLSPGEVSEKVLAWLKAYE